MKNRPFSVLLSVYCKESPVFLKQSLDSILSQTMIPHEIVLVKDGPLGDSLDRVIESYSRTWPQLFKVVGLKKNLGLGPALNAGFEFCSHPIVARMDSDDIAVKERFEWQLEYLENHPEVTVVGGFVEEFNTRPGDMKQIKTVPLEHEELKSFSRTRNPLNHPSVMFRKSPIISMGGYQPVTYFEDYFLWLKLLDGGFKLANIGKVLLYFRTGNDMISRRQGYRYANHEMSFIGKAYRENLLDRNDLIRAITTRIPLRFVPKRILKFIYKNKLRVSI